MRLFKITFLPHVRLQPVSYTHLDVYKRQPVYLLEDAVWPSKVEVAWEAGTTVLHRINNLCS